MADIFDQLHSESVKQPPPAQTGDIFDRVYSENKSSNRAPYQTGAAARGLLPKTSNPPLGGGGRGGLPPASPEGKEAAERAKTQAPRATTPVGKGISQQEPGSGEVKPNFEKIMGLPVGAAKGAIHTAKNLADITETATGFGLIDKALSSKKAQDQRKEADTKLEEWLKPEGWEKLGYAVEQLGEFFVPETKLGEVAKIPEVAAKALKLGKIGAKATEDGLKLAAVTFAQTKDPKDAAYAFAAGTGTSAAFGSIRGPLGTWLAKNARETYSQILRPGGGKVKSDVARLLSGGAKDLVGRKFISTSTEKMEEEAATKATELGKQIDQAYEKLGESHKLKLQPIFNDIYAYIAKEGLKEKGGIAGTGGREYVSLGLGRLNEIVKYYGKEFGEADPRDLRQFRQLLDEELYKPNASGKSVKTVTTRADKVTNALSNSIRNVLNSDPTIGKLNQEFHFWQSAREVLRARNIGDIGKSQTPKGLLMVGRGIAGAALGSAGGYEHERSWSGALEGAAIGAGAATMLTEIFASTAWKGVSAVTKDRMAKLLLEGAQYEAAGIGAKEAAFKATDPYEKQKLIAISKKLAAERGAKSAVSKYMGSGEESAIKTVTPPKKGTSSPPQYKPEQWQIKAATEKVISDTGVKPKDGEFKKVAKESYEKVQTEAEKQAEATNSKIEQKKSDTYSKPFGIKKQGEVTPAEGTAISSYKGAGYQPINKSLYMGGEPHYHVKEIDSAIAKHQLENDTTLWRGVNGKYAEQIKTMKPGDIIPNKGYSSTSSAPKISRSFAGKGGVLIKIDAKAGQAGYPYGFADAEKEYLLPRGMKFKIKSIEKDEMGIPNVTVEVVK